MMPDAGGLQRGSQPVARSGARAEAAEKSGRGRQAGPTDRGRPGRLRTTWWTPGWGWTSGACPVAACYTRPPLRARGPGVSAEAAGDGDGFGTGGARGIPGPGAHRPRRRGHRSGRRASRTTQRAMAGRARSHRTSDRWTRTAGRCGVAARAGCRSHRRGRRGPSRCAVDPGVDGRRPGRTVAVGVVEQVDDDLGETSATGGDRQALRRDGDDMAHVPGRSSASATQAVSNWATSTRARASRPAPPSMRERSAGR